MKRQKIKHHMSSLGALLLFGVFAACVMAVLFTGAGAYERLIRRDQAAYDRRTCVQYIATRVRQGDIEGGVTVEPFGDTTALCMTQDGYMTRIYWHDGYLMELYTSADAELYPEDGEKIMPLESLSLAMEDGLVTAEIGAAGGVVDTLRLSLRCGEGDLL